MHVFGCLWLVEAPCGYLWLSVAVRGGCLNEDKVEDEEQDGDEHEDENEDED